jgi:hypothetical protein
MQLKVNSLVRSILIGLVAFLLFVTPAIIKTILPATSLSAQETPILDNSSLESPQINNLPNSNQLELDDRSNYGNILPHPTIVAKPVTSPYYIPQQTIVSVDPSNYDPRATEDIYGNPINNQPIVVLHETVGSATSAINTFRNYHPKDRDQVSYHALIQSNGIIVYLVPPEMRAFGAGNSVFNGPSGPETVRLHPTLPPSVNNFAYHVSLETPADGRGNRRSHSGYTALQYQSLAWLIAQTNIPQERITTHKAVDRSRSRQDPRSFSFSKFWPLLQAYRSNNSPAAIGG